MTDDEITSPLPSGIGRIFCAFLLTAEAIAHWKMKAGGLGLARRHQEERDVVSGSRRNGGGEDMEKFCTISPRYACATLRMGGAAASSFRRDGVKGGAIPGSRL